MQGAGCWLLVEYYDLTKVLNKLFIEQRIISLITIKPATRNKQQATLDINTFTP